MRTASVCREWIDERAASKRATTDERDAAVSATSKWTGKKRFEKHRTQTMFEWLVPVSNMSLTLPWNTFAPMNIVLRLCVQTASATARCGMRAVFGVRHVRRVRRVRTRQPQISLDEHADVNYAGSILCKSQWSILSSGDFFDWCAIRMAGGFSFECCCCLYVCVCVCIACSFVNSLPKINVLGNEHNERPQWYQITRWFIFIVQLRVKEANLNIILMSHLTRNIEHRAVLSSRTVIVSIYSMIPTQINCHLTCYCQRQKMFCWIVEADWEFDFHSNTLARRV